MTLTQKYRKEIQEWDWEAFKEEAKRFVEKNDNGEQEGRYFIGTVFNLMPSGKYYMPFACSNVTPCPHCKGEGSLSNAARSPKTVAVLTQVDTTLRSFLLETFGAFFEKKWPNDLHSLLRHMESLTQRYRDRVTCPTCHGIGSEEAYKDECFQEALDGVADDHGMFIQRGEGDPCDMFACIIVEIGEPEDEE